MKLSTGIHKWPKKRWEGRRREREREKGREREQNLNRITTHTHTRAYQSKESPLYVTMMFGLMSRM